MTPEPEGEVQDADRGVHVTIANNLQVSADFCEAIVCDSTPSQHDNQDPRLYYANVFLWVYPPKNVSFFFCNYHDPRG